MKLWTSILVPILISLIVSAVTGAVSGRITTEHRLTRLETILEFVAAQVVETRAEVKILSQNLRRR